MKRYQFLYSKRVNSLECTVILDTEVVVKFHATPSGSNANNIGKLNQEAFNKIGDILRRDAEFYFEREYIWL